MVAPELKVGAACSHTEKGAKASRTRELKELPMQGINSLCSTGQVVLGRGPHLFYTPKENIPVFARLSWLGKAYRAPGVIRNTGGVRAGGAPVPWETPAMPVPNSHLPEPPKPSGLGLLQEITKAAPSTGNK